MNKTNHRLKGDGQSRKVWLDGKILFPGKSLKVRDHSPDGFSWGYGGSGPAQLALAIMLELTGKADGYQEFKWKVIAALEEDFDISFNLEDGIIK